MSTSSAHGRIAAALFGKGRRAVLAVLFGRAGRAFYVREVARAAGCGLGAAQRELARLSAAGLLRRSVRGRQVYYEADPRSPVFAEIKGLIVKTAGTADVLRAALSTLAERIRFAFLFGSIAEGREGPESDVDVLVVGNATFADVVAALTPAQTILGREVNPAVFPPAEFRRKLEAGHHFLRSVVAAPKLFLIGDDDELAGVAQSGLAHAAPVRRAGNRRSLRRRRPRSG